MRFTRRSTCALIIGVVAVGLVGVNAVAYMQAQAMTHFAASGKRTERPEHLDALAAARVIAFGVSIPRPQNTSTPEAFGLAYETHHFPSGHGPTLEAWYITDRDGWPLVLIFHGYGASKEQVLSVAKVLHELGYPTLLVDFYGSGGSSGNDTSLGYLEARDVAASVAYARQQWPGRKIVLHGFSMGSAAILRSIAVEGVAQVDHLPLERSVPMTDPIKSE